MLLGWAMLCAHIPRGLATPTNAVSIVTPPQADALKAGWWEALGLGTPAADEGLRKWNDQLSSIDTSALSQTARAELDGLRDKLEEWQALKPASKHAPLPNSPRTLRDMLEIVRLREQLQIAFERSSTHLRRLETMQKFTDQRRNAARNEYLNEPSSDPTTRLAQGWRWMRLWLGWKLIEKQTQSLKEERTVLEARKQRLDHYIAQPLDELVYDRLELEHWQKRAATINWEVEGTVIALDELPTIQELRHAIDLQDQQLSSLIARLAIVLCSAQIGQVESQHLYKTRPDPQSIRTWRFDTQTLIELRRAEITRTLESNHDSTSKRHPASSASLQLQSLASVNSDMQQLRVKIEQYSLLDRSLKQRQGGLWSEIENSWRGVVDSVDAAFHHSLFTVRDYSVTLLDFLRFLIIVALFYGASLGLRAFVSSLETKRSLPPSSVFLLRRVIHFSLMIVGCLIALSTMGIDLTKFAIFASALGVGLGLGLQSIAKNFVAGFVILIERSLKIGDFIELESGTRGAVREINLRGTVITTPDNIDIMIPNSEFVDGKVTNWTMRDTTCRLRIPFFVAYGTPKDKTKAAIISAANSLPFTVTQSPRHPQVWLTRFGDSALCYTLIVWVEGDATTRPDAVVSAYNWAIETALSEAGIEIPYPQQDIRIRSYFGQQNEQALSLLHPKRRNPVVETVSDGSHASGDDLSVNVGPMRSDNDAAEDTLEGIAKKRREQELREGPATEQIANCVDPPNSPTNDSGSAV